MFGYCILSQNLTIVYSIQVKEGLKRFLVAYRKANRQINSLQYTYYRPIGIYYASRKSESGLFNLSYTPTLKGQYDIVVTIGGVNVQTDLSAGVWTYPAVSSGPHSTQTSELHAVEGTFEYILQ